MKWIDTFLKQQVKRKYQRINKMLANPIEIQKDVFKSLITQGKRTAFGKDHGFEHIDNYKQFRKQVPLRDYEALTPYIDRIKDGERDVLWPGFPRFFGITSGTTSKVKYIPVSKESIHNHIKGPQYIGLNYAHKYAKIDYLKGKILLFSDGLSFKKVAGLKTAPISSIKHSQVPKFYSLRSLPGTKVNSIKDFDARLNAMVDTSLGQDIRSIVAMPVWFMTYLRRINDKTGKTLKELFPNFELLISSGMSYRPYLPEYNKYIGGKFNILETYPSTEGFLAYQDRLEEKGFQLVLDQGIFFEFVPSEKIHLEHPDRYSLEEVELNKDYAIVLNSNAGLWGYILGDVVRFVTLDPYRIEIRGRVSQFISAFGEHVVASDTDRALNDTLKILRSTVVNYTVAPNFPQNELPYHEWFIEFGTAPEDINLFAKLLDDNLGKYNFFYQKTVARKAIAPLRIRTIRKGGFLDYLKREGKTSMQQKIPQVNNDEYFSSKLRDYMEQT